MGQGIGILSVWLVVRVLFGHATALPAQLFKETGHGVDYER
jgi:hypothetical protein